MLVNSTIEFMRKRYHGIAKLRLLALNADGESLTLLLTLTKGFLITRNVDTIEGAPSHSLTIDINRTANATEAIVQQIAYVELINESTGEARRFKAITNTAPLVEEWRYVLDLHPAFSDLKAITNV
jgi:hypothetical protein